MYSRNRCIAEREGIESEISRPSSLAAEMHLSECLLLTRTAHAGQETA